ncbi:MAG: glycosyltransferase family 2 protein [Candidatus Saccharibacteria bacterium]|nr:glycosyltransferase family 2 protein [Candidatus Saccharibacteria bacterium]
MKDKSKFITIMTPTYNRANLLPRLYESLKNQTSYDFEWVVIDDGSTDQTEEIINQFQQNQPPFPIIYQKQVNGGKHRAINHALKIANGKMFFIVDSDDYLTNDAIANVIKDEEQLPKGQKFAGLGKAKGWTLTEQIGNGFNSDFIDATSLERSKYSILGDKAEIFYTEILRQYPFPEFESEKFMEEAYVWNLIAEVGYKLRWDNDIIYIAEYLDDGLTKNIRSKHKQSPKGFALYIKQLINHESSFLKKIFLAGMYNRDVHDYDGIVETSKALGVSRVLVLLGTIIRKLFRK